MKHDTKNVYGRADMNMMTAESHHWLHLDYEGVVIGICKEIYIEVEETAFKAACPIVKPSFLKPTRGETPVRSTQACFPPIHPKTKISPGLRVDLPSNGSLKKLTGASFLAEIPARLNTSKRTSLTMSCRYLKPGRSLQCIACSPNESKHALRQIGHNSSTGKSGIKRRYLRMVPRSNKEHNSNAESEILKM
ncbi:hypothetical protein LXL04_008969 [Taraxacum kok-saghyz]